MKRLNLLEYALCFSLLFYYPLVNDDPDIKESVRYGFSYLIIRKFLNFLKLCILVLQGVVSGIILVDLTAEIINNLRK